MTKVTSIFSNGHTDVYKGKRDVRAGWMVVTPNGHTLSGHSKDRPTAEKTARSAAADMAGYRCVYSSRSRYNTVAYMQGARQYVKKCGYKSLKEMEADYAAKREAFVRSCKIEIIDL